MLKSSTHPFWKLSVVQMTIKKLVPNLWKKGTRAFMLLPWYHPVCLLPVSEEKPLQLCSAGEKDHSFLVHALHGNSPPLLLVIAHGARKTFLGGPLTRRFRGGSS